jgi:hypothetical protein
MNVKLPCGFILLMLTRLPEIESVDLNGVRDPVDAVWGKKRMPNQ